MNTENNLPENELYENIANVSRNTILLILNFTIFVLIVQVYPKLDQTELMTSLSVGVSIICSFYFFVLAKEISLKTILPANAFLLLNISAASITNDYVWYTSLGIIIFLMVTFVTARIRTSKEQKTIFTFSFVGMYLSTAFVWFAKRSIIETDYLWEIALSQLILAGALYYYLFKKTTIKESPSYLPVLPLLLNVILIPVFLTDNLVRLFYLDIGLLSSYDKISVFRYDYSLLLFGVFLIVLYLYLTKVKDAIYIQNSVLISAALLFFSVIILAHFRESNYDFISLGDQFFTLSLIYLLFIGLTIFIAKQEINTITPSIAVFAIIAVSIAAIFEFILVIHGSAFDLPFLSPLVLTIGISAPLIILFWTENETTRESCVVLQTIGVALFAFLPEQGFWLASERFDSYISIVFAVYFSAIAYLAWTNVSMKNRLSFYFPILYLWFMVGAFVTDMRIPSFAILVLAILTLTIFAFFSKEEQSGFNVLSSQVLAVLILSFYNFKNLLEIEEMNILMNEIFEDIINSFSGGIESPFITLCYILIQAVLIFKWITFTAPFIAKNKISDTFMELSITRELYAFLSLSFSAVLLVVNLFNELPVVNIVISIGILLVVSLPLLKSELIPESTNTAYTLFGLSAAAIFLLFTDSSYQIAFGPEDKISISAVTFLVYSAVLVGYTFKNRTYLSVSIIHSLSVLTFLLIVFDSSTDLPIEFAAVTILLLFLYILNVKDEVTISHATISQCLLLIFLAMFQITAFDRNASLLSESDLNYFISAIYLIYVGSTALFVIPSLKSTTSVLAGYTILLLIYSILRSELSVDPVILGIAIFALTYNLFIDFDKEKLSSIPLVQSLGIVFSLFYSWEQGAIYELEWSIVLFIIWASSILVIWFIKSGAPQLLLAYITGIFGLSGVLSIYLFILNEGVNGSKILNLYALVGVLSISSIMVLIFEMKSRVLSSCTLNQVNFATRIIMVGMAITGIVIRTSLPLGSIEWLIARVAIDLFVFLPMLIQSRFYIAWILETLPANRETEKESEIVELLTIDNLRNNIIIGYAITALVIGIDSFFSLKFIAIVLVLWTFPGVFEKAHTTWIATISTVSAIAFILYQLPIPPGKELISEVLSYTEFVIYTLIVTLIGIIIVFGAFINEYRYKGEPLTSALVVNGSILAIFAIFMPRWVPHGSVFGVPSDTINFLPDIIWALIGFSVFIFGYNHGKDALRKFGLAIVYMDFALALFDVYTTVGSFPIRIFTTALLGILGLTMYYKYVKVEE